MQVHFVKSARKDNAVVKAGESYYWWQHAFQRKQLSKEKPTRAQIQNSSFLANLYDLEDSKPTIDFNYDDPKESFEALATEIESFIESIQELKDECEESLQNMPEHLQETSPAGITLQERIDALDDFISTLETIDASFEENEEQTKEDIEAAFDAIQEEFHDACSEL